MQLVQLSVLFLVQTHFCWGQYTIVTPPQVVMAPVGSDVTLPCQVEPAADLREQVVEWARLDLTPPYVHIRRDALDFHIYQNPLYLARTALSESRLQKGDLSLSLSRVKLSDEGTYRCFLPQTDTEAQVTLLVVAPPSISVEKDPSGSVVLRCESVGWSPEPELQWLDSEGTVVLRAEAQRGSDDLFSVSSRLTVQQIQGNTFTCRVQHQPSGASREARLHISDEKVESCSSCSLAWTLFALCLSAAAAAAALVVWKFKANKQKSEMKDFELGEREEKEGMLRRGETIEDELKYLEEVIHKLSDTKTFLMKLKEQPQAALYHVISLLEAEKNKPGSMFGIMDKKEMKKHNIDKLEGEKKVYEKTIADIEEQIVKTEETILMSLKRKSVMVAERMNMTKFTEKEKKQRETESLEKVKEKSEAEQVNDEGKTQNQNEAERKPEGVGEDMNVLCDVEEVISIHENTFGSS
ncbi:unnamed protein product [Knipowitschia caucasica]